MQVIFPRVVGVLVVLYIPWVVATVEDPRWVWPLTEISWPSWIWLVAAAAWAVPAVVLMRAQRVRLGALLLAGMCVGSFPLNWGGDDFFLWIAIILFATEGHPHERALLLRVMVSAVYGFAALAKLNPSWLAGDQLVRLGMRVPHLEGFLPWFLGPTGRLLAVAVVLVEAWMAVGLWFKRTRATTAILGLLVHLMLIGAASEDLIGAFDLLPLNLGLVAMYLAFWFPLPRLASKEERSERPAIERVRAIAMR